MGKNIPTKKQPPTLSALQIFDATKWLRRIARGLEHLRENVCAYSPGTTFCDCKYGADKQLGHGEVGNGCPELRTAIQLLQWMRPDEYDTIMKRAARAAARQRVKEKARQQPKNQTTRKNVPRKPALAKRSRQRA